MPPHPHRSALKIAVETADAHDLPNPEFSFALHAWLPSCSLFSHGCYCSYFASNLGSAAGLACHFDTPNDPHLDHDLDHDLDPDPDFDPDLDTDHDPDPDPDHDLDIDIDHDQ